MMDQNPLRLMLFALAVLLVYTFLRTCLCHC